MFMMDSNASERRATEPEMYHAPSLTAKITRPPPTATRAAPRLSILPITSQGILLGVSMSILPAPYNIF